MLNMADEIDGLAAFAYELGQDPITVAVDLVATMIKVRDEVLRGRQEEAGSFAVFGSAEPPVVARRIMASLLNAGWRPPDDEAVESAANQSRRANRRLDEWLDGLTPEERERVLDHYAHNGDFPPDQRPPA
jgi:hypothetical protein